MKKNTINHISIVITGRNAISFVDRCLESAISQVYEDFEIIFIDALSTDGTFEQAKNFENKFKNIRFIQNETRKYQGENIRIGCEISPIKSIIVTLDSDDFLPHGDVLSRVNAEYNKHDCWMTYGKYCESPYRDVSMHYFEYPLEVRRDKKFRQYRWLASHLRTFRRELFLKINPDDMKDPQTGNYVSMAPDLSFQFPMLEMCGETKSRHIPDILYVYNRENPMSEANINQSEIDRIEAHLRSLKPYPTLEKLYEDE